MIVVDSREKKWGHIKSYFDLNNIEYAFPHKLDVGDYFNPDNPTIVIDRKANIQEVCSNLQRGSGNCIRFAKEARRAKTQGLTLIVLIESRKYKSVNDLKSWKSKYSKHTGNWIVKEMFELTVTYGVIWMFCAPNSTGRKIVEILGGIK